MTYSRNSNEAGPRGERNLGQATRAWPDVATPVPLFTRPGLINWQMAGGNDDATPRG